MLSRREDRYAGQIIMGGCLQIELAPWKRVALARAIALGPALLVATATVGNSHLYNSINEYLNVLQSVQLPFAMLPVLHFSLSKRLMARYVPNTLLMAVSFCMALLVLGVNLQLVVSTVGPTPTYSTLALVVVVGALYSFVCLCTIWEDIAHAVAAVDRVFCMRTLGVGLKDARSRQTAPLPATSSTDPGSVE